MEALLSKMWLFIQPLTKKFQNRGRGVIKKRKNIK
jgi:hypothetical protein